MSSRVRNSIAISSITIFGLIAIVLSSNSNSTKIAVMIGLTVAALITQWFVYKAG